MKYFLSIAQGGNRDGYAAYPAGEAHSVAEARDEIRRMAAGHPGSYISKNGLTAKWSGPMNSGGTPWWAAYATPMMRGGYYDREGFWINPGDANFHRGV